MTRPGVRPHRSLRPWFGLAVLAGCAWWFGATGAAQEPSATPHPIPTTPPGAVATRPPGPWVDPPPPPDGCLAETEPNDQPVVAGSLPTEFCLGGTLVEYTDQDLFFWDVAPEDGITTWDVTVRGVPTAYTSIRFFPLTSPPDVLPLEIEGIPTPRVDSDVWIGTPPLTGQVQLAPGRYLLGISRGLPGYKQDITDDRQYWVHLRRGGSPAPRGDTEPNEAPTQATPISGAVRLGGDLGGTHDVYRWSLGPDDVATPWRVTVRSPRKARLTVEVQRPDGTTVSYASADAHTGEAVVHDLGLTAGDYLIELTPAAVDAQPYELMTEPVTEPDVDREPNDLPEQAIVVGAATEGVSGRLTSAADIDSYLVDIDAALATGLVDIALTWNDGLLRTFCLQTAERVQIACEDGYEGVALRGVLVPEGRYLLVVRGAGGLDDRYHLAVTPSGIPQPAREVEPNDDAATAGAVSGPFAVRGDLLGSVDTFAWTLDDTAASSSWHLDASLTPGLGAYLDITAADGTPVARASTGYAGTARIWDLRLPPGTYTVSLGANSGQPPAYVLRAVAEPAQDIDPEPNDQMPQAVALDPETLTARGRIAAYGDTDRYSFEVTDELSAGLVEAEMTWPGRQELQLCVTTEFGSAIQCAGARDGVTLGRLDLAPGRYGLQVAGNASPDTRYDVRVGADVPRSPDGESEPNDLDEAADPWDPSIVMHGTSHDGDVDRYLIHLEPAVPEIWRLEATGADIAQLEWRQPDGTHVGSIRIADDGMSATIEDLFLVSGDHLLTVRGGGDYELSMTSLGSPDLAAEREPNDIADRAGPLAMGGTRTGRLPPGGDVDVYRFSLAAPEHVVITAQPTAGSGGALDASGGALDLEITSATTSLAKVAAPEAGGETVFDGLLQQGDYEVSVRAASDATALLPAPDLGYAIGLERGDPFLDPASPPPDVLAAELSVSVDDAVVAAYWQDGQRVDALLRIDASAPLELDLDAVTSHHAWWVDLPADVSVPGSGTTEVPITIHVPPDAWRDVPVRVTVRARTADGAQVTTSTDVTPVQDVLPVAPEQVWPIPDALLGGLDVASSALGGEPLNGYYGQEMLHDGLTVAGTGITGSIQTGPLPIDVDLAGDEPVPVAGTIIDPLGGGGTYEARPRAFELSLSLDGTTYTPVLTGELGPQTHEQSFVLPEAVPARFARLRIDTRWGATPGAVDLGEWKVIATPGYAPFAEPIDLADWRRGAHVVWSEPAVQPAGEILGTTDTGIRQLALDAEQAQDLVIGFADDRAAQVTGLRWQDPVASVPAARFSSVAVSVALDSPLGPWTDLGTWDLARAADGTPAPFDLPQPTWARFVRLSAVGSSEEFGYWELPGKISVLERPTDDTYRSVLGQWGRQSPRAIHELLVPAAVEAAAEDIDAGDSADGATLLAADAVGRGYVARTVDTDWYELTVPDDKNTLALVLDTERAGDVRMRVRDASGALIEPSVVAPTADGTLMQLIVEPGSTYRVELEQPILSVVFTFDTSSSISPWFPLVRASIGAFGGAVRPGLEAVQMFPFEEPALLEDWSDQPYLIQSAIDAWQLGDGSSYLEASVIRAAETLHDRDGAHAILAVGDGVGGGFLGGLPVRRLGETPPAIFPIHIGGVSDPAVSTRIMQDLALVNGGFYQYASSLGEMERAFDRMATWLRRPAGYALSYQTSLLEYPPGSIAVVPAPGAQVRIGGVAVSLVLDTSGSMLRKLGDSTRIAVAKRSLTQLIEEALPEGLPVALRTFRPGNRSCGTRLAVPLGPLDRADMLDRIKRLKIDRRTRTPIAASIEAAAGDIAEATGPRVVVVVTDGAETCDGDPEAAVRSLVEAGVDTTVNIVGFALNSEALKERMASWAAAGGGVFTDAQNQADLSTAITDALRAPYRVYDEAGALVGEGIVGGDAITLPMGTYRVEVLAHPEPIIFDGVRVATGQNVQLEVGGQEP